MKNQNSVPTLISQYKNSLESPISSASKDIEKFFLCIRERIFDNALTLSTVKEECGIKGKSFSARFKRVIGRYPYDYILYHRIEMAKILLKNTKNSITDIALETGFNSLSSFDKTFLSRVGQSPSAWRLSQVG
jgi:AraC-like DNA-binding protein